MPLPGEGPNDDMPSRRDFLSSGAVLGVSALLGGCSSFSGDGSPDEDPTDGPSPTERPDTATPSTATEAAGTDDPDSLHIATTDALLDVLGRAATYWNGNPMPASDDYGRSIAAAAGSDELGLASYFGERHGFSPSKEQHRPPFRVTVGDGSRHRNHDALEAGTVDIAGLGSETYTDVAEDLRLPDDAVRHDLFRTGRVLAVSASVARAGVTSLTPAELRGIYDGRVTNWAAVGGPDRPIHLVTTVGTNPSPPFEQTFLDGAGGGADELYGRPRRRMRAVRERDDVLTRFFLPSVRILQDGGTSEYQILDVEIDGEPRGPGGLGYPGTYPIPLFTRESPGNRERAFLDMLTTAAVHPWLLPDDGGLHVLPAESPPTY